MEFFKMSLISYGKTMYLLNLDLPGNHMFGLGYSKESQGVNDANPIESQ